MADLDKPRLRRSEAAICLEKRHGLTVAVAKFATVGGGPTFNKFGRIPLYEPAQLDAWAKERFGRAMTSTSDAAWNCGCATTSDPVCASALEIRAARGILP